MSNQFYKEVSPIKKDAKPLRGGLWHVLYCPLERVNYFPDVNPASNKIDDDFDVDAWFRVNSSNYKKGYREESRTGDGGDYLEITVTVNLPFESAENHQSLDRLKYHRYILAVITPLGLVKILGTKENPVTLRQAGYSGENPKEESGTQLTFFWVSEDKPLLCSSALVPVIG